MKEILLKGMKEEKMTKAMVQTLFFQVAFTLFFIIFVFVALCGESALCDFFDDLPMLLISSRRDRALHFSRVLCFILFTVLIRKKHETVFVKRNLFASFERTEEKKTTTLIELSL